MVLQHLSVWDRLLEFSQALNNSLKKTYKLSNPAETFQGEGLKGHFTQITRTQGNPADSFAYICLSFEILSF